MSARPGLVRSLGLRGLRAAPSQVLGSVRLVPLLRDAPGGDLRMARRSYEDPMAIVALGGDAAYCSTYLPHAIVVGWSDDGSPAATFGAALAGGADGRSLFKGARCAQLLHRMARREQGSTLRILPQHLAMEGFLALHFNGPDVAWSEYSRRAISRGLDPRWEETVAGRSVPGLEDALRVFEIHEGQSGALLFLGDVMASAFVVSHPDDYRGLHRTLIEDGFSEELWQAAQWSGPSPELAGAFDEERVGSIGDLRLALARARRQAAAFHVDMAAGVIARPVASQRVYRAGPFSLQRFVTDLNPREENHIGEVIVRDDGTLEYARTYRLSAGQTRRAYLLQKLATHSWNLDATAASLGVRREELVVRLDRAGFGYLVAEHVLKAAQRRAR